MGEKTLGYIIIILVFLIFYMVINFKFKNLIPEIYNKMLLAVIYFMLIVKLRYENGFLNGLYDLLYILLIMAAAIVAFTVLKKNKIYFFKGIDKKFIKSRNNEILHILQEYKNNNLDDEASIHLEKSSIVFNGLNKLQIKECISLIGSYIDENKGKYTIDDYVNYYVKTVAVPVIITLAVVTIFIKILSYRPTIEVSEKINIENEYSIGNTEGNINNYGMVAETDDSIYFVRDYKIYKTDKELKNEIIVVDEPANLGKDTINVVEDWIFYRRGKEINRVKTDGKGYEILFIGYSLHMQVVGNWIYFNSVDDDSKICKIDVNGQNKQFLSDGDIKDMAVYDGKIYYSYKNKEEGFLEVMNMDGSNKQFLSNIRTRNMIVDEEYIYYLDDIEEKLYRMNLKDKTREPLSNEQILKFIKDDSHIYYTLKTPDDSDWRFKGLYRMNIDGSNVVSLDGDTYLDEMGMGVTKDYIFYVAANGKEQPRLKIINMDGIMIK